MKCPKCFADVADGTRFCPACGEDLTMVSQPAPIVEQPAQTAYAQPVPPMDQPVPPMGQPVPPMGQPMPPMGQPVGPVVPIVEKKNKTPIIIVSIVAGVLAFILVFVLIAGVFGGSNSPLDSRIKFNSKYSYMEYEDYCTMGSDGKWMKLDTNPDDIDSDYFYSYSSTAYAAIDAIKQVNADLGFSDALYNKMETTTALQGTQTDSNDKYKVTWTYHPDHGLEVMYEYV